MSQPIITPRKFLQAIYGRDTLPPEVAGCTCAVVAFGQFRDMRRKLAAEPAPTPLFSLLHQTHQFIGHVAGRTILALENVQGGPLAATVVEELAHYGITQVLGYGYAGSLTRTVPIGQLVLAEGALISDGTSRAYLPQATRAAPDDALVRELRGVRRTDGSGAVWGHGLDHRHPVSQVSGGGNGLAHPRCDGSEHGHGAFLCGQSCGGVVGGLCVCGVRWYRSSHLGRRQTGHSPREGVLQDLIVAMLSRILGQFSPGK
jgi:hypothetical protein